MAHHRVIATTVMQQRSWRRGRQAITAAAAAIAIAGAGADGRIANCPPSGTRCGGNGALHLVTRHRHGSWCRGVACQCRGLGVPSQAFDGLQGILGSSLNSSRCHHVRVLHVQAAAAEHEHRQHGVPHYPHGVPAGRGRGRRFHPWPSALPWSPCLWSGPRSTSRPESIAIGSETPEYPTMLALSAFTTGYLSGSPAIGAQRANVRMAVVSKPSQWSHV